MQDRFKFRLIVEKDYKTINGTFKGIQVYYCNGFLQGKTKTTFFGNGKKYSFFNSQIKHINQSTGLKDKNNKLIYEGDIVKDRNNFILQITYRQDKGAFYLENNRIAGAISELKCSTNTMEVIGNIYETPELIGGE